MIAIIFFAVVLILILYLFNADVLKRNPVITVVTNLPLGIFKAENKQSVSPNENKSDIKVTEKECENLICKEIIQESLLELKEKDELNEVAQLSEEKEIIVYWTPNGKSYHMKDNCISLSRSKVIHSGRLNECEKDICCSHCKIKEHENKI